MSFDQLGNQWFGILDDWEECRFANALGLGGEESAVPAVSFLPKKVKAGGTVVAWKLRTHAQHTADSAELVVACQPTVVVVRSFLAPKARRELCVPSGHLCLSSCFFSLIIYEYCRDRCTNYMWKQFRLAAESWGSLDTQDSGA